LESHQQRHWDRDPSRSFEEVMVEYMRVAANRRSADTIRYFVKELRTSFEGRAMEGLRGADIAAHITRRRAERVKDSSINRELEVLSAAINHARYHLEWNLPNPVQGRMLKEPEGRVRWISREEAARLLEARHTKAGKRRSVPLNRAAREAILARARFQANHCAASPWVFCKMDGKRIYEARKGFLAACAKVGIMDFCFHDLRHTCAAWLVSAGVPLTDVRDLLGHSTVSMTERYAHLAPERVKSAVAVLDEVAESRLTIGGGLLVPQPIELNRERGKPAHPPTWVRTRWIWAA
jgi:integrase